MFEDKTVLSFETQTLRFANKTLFVVNKKHAIVMAVERNQVTVFVNGETKTITCKPGVIRWNSDKVLAHAVGSG